MAELGCAAEYQALIADRGGQRLVSAESLPFTDLEWGRRLDGVSTARVRIDTGQAPDCCGILADIRAGRHELVIFRDGERVWEGPIVSIPAGRDEVQIVAADVAQYLAWRATHASVLCWTSSCGGGPADLAQIARRVVENALGERAEDPNVIPHLQVSRVGVTGEREYEGYTPALDILDDLARTTLDYTVLGRSIVIGSPLAFGNLPRLTCDDFAGDVQTVEDAAAAATRVIVKGDEGVVGIAGGADPYYGLMELVVEDDDIKDQTSATYAARQILAVSRPPLVWVSTPRGSELAPTAPVGINDLVPGAMTPVALDCTCRPAVSVLRLTEVKVTMDAAGERVRVSLTPQTETP